MNLTALRIAWTVIIALGVMLPSPSHGGVKNYDIGVLLNQPHPFEKSVADRPPPIVSRRHRNPTPSQAVSVFGGWLTDNNFEEVFTPWELGFRASAIAGVAASRRLGRHGKNVSFEIEGQIVRHIGKQDHWEFNLPLITRWETFPWDDKIETSVAFGIGPSYATEVPNQEVAMDGESQQWLVYWVVELAMGLPGSDWQGILRLHHRSGAFGLIADDGGSNILVLGAKRHF